MSELSSRLSNLNPFSKSNREDDDDKGEAIVPDSVGGGGPIAQRSELKKDQLRVSQALRSFIVHEKIMSEDAAGVDSTETTATLRALLGQNSFEAPKSVLDRSRPLPEYFVSSSHNTYLLAHQLYGKSCATAYDTAIKTGSRCVEIDAWDDSDDANEPKVTHGYTLVSHVSFRNVCEAIRDVFDEEAALAADQQGQSVAPILLSLENHCGPQGQLRLAQIMREVFGHRLLSEAIRREGSLEQEGVSKHVTLEELGHTIAVIVEFHLPDEAEDSDSSSSDESEDEEQKDARKAYKDQKKTTASSIIVPDLAELGVYAQSVKPRDNSWYDPGELINGPHHHLINVSESGLSAHLPANSELISRHNAHHLMRVFPKGTRISSSNLKPIAYWGIGAQICALNWQSFGASNQLNSALFNGSDGYILKPAALRAGGNGKLGTGQMKKLRIHVAGATDIPLHEERDDEIKPYLTCTLHSPLDRSSEPPKRKTSPYKHHKLGFLHRGDNPPSTDPIWDEQLEWEYEDNELVFLRMLIKSDDSWARNPKLAIAAVRLSYSSPGWSFIRMTDLKGRETKCTLFVKFEVLDV